MLFNRDDCEFNGQLTEASQGSVLSCTDSDSELGPADPQNSTSNTPLLEAEAPSVVPLGGSDSPTPPQEKEDAPLAPQTNAPKPFIPASDSFINSLVSDRDRTSALQPSITEMPQEEREEPPPAPVLQTPDAGGHDVPWMNVDLEGAEAARGAQTAGPSAGDGSAAATYALGTLESSRGVGEEEGPVWAWISGGGCDMDASSQISWLSPAGIWTTSHNTYIVILCFCSILCLWMIVWAVSLSIRSSHHLSVTDSSPVSRLEKTATAAGTQRGDQQETAGKKQRKTAYIWHVS